MSAEHLSTSRRKELGAFYTPVDIAQKMAEWAICDPSDRVLDPSFGGLDLLTAAARRLADLAVCPDDISSHLFGAEIDPETFDAALSGFGVTLEPGQLQCASFFDLTAGVDLPQVEALIGNPPYIRSQEFKENAKRAHEVTAQAGVPLTKLASSWAPFVVHGVSFVAPGGRLAQVLPAEILHANYAQPVIQFLRRSFVSVTLVLFKTRVFPGAQEEVVLLFADDRLPPPPEVNVIEVANLAALDPQRLLATRPRSSESTGGVQLASPAIQSRKLLARLLGSETEALLDRIESSASVARLGDLASVDLGAITGANDFFLLSEDDEAVPAAFARFTVSKATHVQGARLTPADKRRLIESGSRVSMFVLPATADQAALDKVAKYLRRGEDAGIPSGYKCNARAKWWSVPLPTVGVADALLTYCSSAHPRLVANEVGALQTNTLHCIKLRDPALTSALCAGFVNSLTMLSAELVGRSYGGGVLKLEPKEAKRLLLPPLPPKLAEQLPVIDQLVRGGQLERALDVVDAIVLGPGGLGLTKDEQLRLREGGKMLRARRQARATPAAVVNGKQ